MGRTASFAMCVGCTLCGPWPRRSSARCLRRSAVGHSRCLGGQPENRPVGHPPAGGPHYGAVEASEVLYAAPLMIGLGALPGSADPLFRLNLDTCGPCNFPRPNGARFSLVRSLLLYFALCIPDIIIQNENQKLFSSGRSACSSTQHAHHPCPGYGT